MRLLDLEIYAWIARYLEGRATLDEFEDWFIPETWHVEQSDASNPAAIELAATVRDELAALEEGELTEDELRFRLGALEARRTARIRYFQEAIGGRTGTDTKTTEATTEFISAGA